MPATETADGPRPGDLEFAGGALGAAAPLALFLLGVAGLALAGAPDERGFWPVLLAAIGLGLVLAHDAGEYASAVLAGMSRRLAMVMILAWMLAGVLAALLQASGVIEALVALARGGGIAGGAYVAAGFAVAAALSTATGTSLGTLLLAAPLLYPAGAALGAEPAVLLGALLGGATFGDNLSPVSDTTIASAGTQGADMGGVVRTRLRYALPAAAALPPLPAGVASAGPESLLLLAAPTLVVALLLAGRHLLTGLFAGVAAAAAGGLGLGILSPADLLRVEAGAFRASGLLLDGMERAVGVSVFTLLLLGLVGGFEASGLLDRLVAAAERRARGPRGAEAATFLTVSAAVVLTTHSVVALLAVGPFTRRAGERFGLGAYRRANLLDVTVCTWPFLLPYCIPTVLASSLTADAGAMPRLSPLTAGLHNFHSWALLAVIVAAIATGWGRGEG